MILIWIKGVYMKWISLLALLITIGCSSTKDDVADKKHEDIERQNN